MMLAAHQPDLFPHTAFWWKMATADVFDVSVHDQFQNRGFQRRVRMRRRWASWRLEGKPSLCPISEVRLAPDALQGMWEIIAGRYRGSRFWEREAEWLYLAISECPGDVMWAANLHLISAVADRLGIKTTLWSQPPPTCHGVDGLLEMCDRYGATEYLSGLGGKAYMGDDPEVVFAGRGVELYWNRHHARSGDSILSVLMDHEDPLSVVLEEE